MKNIIVAVDFSGGSIHALKYAVRIANKARANITMVWVDKTSEPDSVYSVSQENYRGEVVRRFNDLVEQLKPDFTGGKMDYKLRTGKIYSEVVAFAQSKKADLIVMGSHGVSGFEEYWIGSNANRIVAHAGCPVITVRNKYSFKDEGWKIVLPVDNSNQTLGKLEVSTNLAKLIGAEIHLVTIYSTNLKTMHKRVDNFADKAMKYFEKENVRYVREHFDSQNATKTVIDYAKGVDADLIAIMTEQESNSSSGIIGPNAQQIVNHSPIPVLSVHPSDAGKF